MRYIVCSFPTFTDDAYRTNWLVLATIVFYWRALSRPYDHTRLIDNLTGKHRII